MRFFGDKLKFGRFVFMGKVVVLVFYNKLVLGFGGDDGGVG